MFGPIWNYADYVAAIGPIALAVMGAVLSIKVFDGWKEYVWVGSFCVVGLVSAVGTVLSVNSTKTSQQTLLNAITGGDHFAYLRADDGDLEKGKAQVRLWLEATGAMQRVSLFLHPESSKGDPNDPEYWKFKDSGGSQFREIIYRGGVLSGLAVEPGSYRIEFSAPNGSFVQYLKISEANGVMTQAGLVARDGKTIKVLP